MSSPHISRRTALGGLAATSILIGSSSCGNQRTADAEAVYDIWLPGPQGDGGVPFERQFYTDLLEPFTEEHGISVQLTFLPWESYEENYLTAIASGDGPDIGYMYASMIGMYIDHGDVIPLDEHLSDETRDRMLYLEEGQYDGVQYLLPYAVGNVSVIYANMDILEEVGTTELPSTWDEFISVTERIARDTDKYGVIMPWGDTSIGTMNTAFYPFLWQAGGDLFTEDGSRTAFDSQAGLEAVQFLEELIRTGGMPDIVSGINSDEALEIFLDGRSAFYPVGSAYYRDFTEGLNNIRFIDSLENKTRKTFIANDGLVVTSACPDKALGTKLIEFLTLGENMEEYHAEVRDFPPIATDEEADPEDPFAEVYADTDLLQGLPINSTGDATYNSLYQNLQQVIIGQKSPAQALSDAAKESDAALAVGG